MKCDTKICSVIRNTVKPAYNDNLMGYFSGHLDELQKAEIVNTSKLILSVFIKTHYWINHG